MPKKWHKKQKFTHSFILWWYKTRISYCEICSYIVNFTLLLSMKMLTFLYHFLYFYIFSFLFFMSMYYLHIVKMFTLFSYLHVLFISLLNIVNNIQCVNIYFLKQENIHDYIFRKMKLCVCMRLCVHVWVWMCKCVQVCVCICVCVYAETGPHSVPQTGLKFTANILLQHSECCVTVLLYKSGICGVSLCQE